MPSSISVLSDRVEEIIASFNRHPCCNVLAKEYQVSYTTMWNFFKKHRLKSDRSLLSKVQKEALLIDYAGGMRPRELALKYDIAQQTAQDYVFKYAPEKLARYRKKYINEAFFNTLTEESLWVLGWFYSDGNVHRKSNHFTISAHSNDVETLRLLGRTMGYEVDSIWYSKVKPVCALFGCHPVIHDKLIELGCVPNKSLIIRYPTFFTEDWQHWVFLRGILEGDGHISVKTTGNRPGGNCEIASGSLLFLEDIQRLLHEKLAIRTKITSRPNSNSRRIVIMGGRDPMLRFLDLLYKNGTATLYLDRKFKVYQLMKEIAARPHDWVAVNRHRHTIAHFRSPDGTIYHVNGIHPFAREMGISHAILRALLKPKKWRSAKHGWSAATEDQITAARAAGTLVTKTY